MIYIKYISSEIRHCTAIEFCCHTFVGEITTLQWGIAKNREYLWGTRIYTLSDMKKSQTFEI